MIFNNFEAIQGKYKVIYADPPWSYKVWSEKGKGRSAENHYTCMSKDAIQGLDVPRICEDDALLFLWVTPPCLLEGLELMQKWGFEYVTKGFNWVKLNKKQDTPFMGTGYYTRSNAEDCLIGKRGRGLKRVDAGVRQVVLSKIREHSRKPDEVRDAIVRLVGDVPRLEMFGRTETPGWDVFGNEVGKF